MSAPAALSADDLAKVIDEYNKKKGEGLSNEELSEHCFNFLQELHTENGATGADGAASGTNKRDSMILNEKVQSVLDRNNVNFMIGVDGSEGSHLCLDVLVKLRKKKDTLKVFHSFTDQAQDDLPAEKKEAGVKEALSIKMINGIPDQKLYEYISERRGDDERVKDHISRKLGELRLKGKAPDVWVCGYSGHINRHQNLSHEPSIMGDTKDITLSSIKMPVIIVKHDIDANKRLTWVVAVGGKKHSHLGLDVAVTLSRPRDRIVVIHAYSDTNDGSTYQSDRTLEMIEKDYTDELASVASEGSFYKLLNTGSKTPAEAVIEFVNEDTEVVADFLVIAPRLNETNDHKVSSLTNNLLRQTKTNLVIVKR